VYKSKLLCYNKIMSKEFKRCPRCNFKTHKDMGRCGKCGLNFIKFQDATNKEAKSAFRMGEKERVLLTKQRPSDVSKVKVFFMNLFGGWFGLHYFALGRLWRGLFQLVGLILGAIYVYCHGTLHIVSGYMGYFVILCGFVWVASFVIWLSDIWGILFDKFKYPVSLPYTQKIEIDSTIKTIDTNN